MNPRSSTGKLVAGNGIKIMYGIIASDAYPKIKLESDFAKAIGAYPATISDWKSGRSCPTIQHIEICWRKFRIEPNEFFGVKDTKMMRFEKELKQMKRVVMDLKK